MGFIFVDNTDLIVITEENETIDNAKDRKQQSTLCKKTLEIIGGALKPAQWYWYLIDFQWKNGEWSCKPHLNRNAKLWVFG